MMGQTSAGVTWLVRTHAGAWMIEPCKHKKCNRHLLARLWFVYCKCTVDHGYRE